MSAIIEARGLTKVYGEVHALDGLDLVAESGRVTALLGPNGAGKTTFISAVATLVAPTSGDLRVAGIDARRAPQAGPPGDRPRRAVRLGRAGDDRAGEPRADRPPVRPGQAAGQDRGRTRCSSGSASTDAGDRLVRTYSGGMRRRLDLGASLVGSPHLLLLDEPTTGLDPRSRMELWEAIRGLVADGTDVLLTTQYLEEADQLARDVVIIDHGHVIAAGTPDELKSQAGRDVIEVRPATPQRPRPGGRDPRPVAAERTRIDDDTQRVSRPVDGGAEQLATVVRLLDEQRHRRRRHRPAPPDARRGVPHPHRPESRIRIRRRRRAVRHRHRRLKEPPMTTITVPTDVGTDAPVLDPTPDSASGAGFATTAAGPPGARSCSSSARRSCC